VRIVAKNAVFCEVCGAKKQNGDTKKFTPTILDKWLFDFVESGHVERSVSSSELAESFEQFVDKTGADFYKCYSMSLGRYLSKLGIKRSRVSIDKHSFWCREMISPEHVKKMFEKLRDVAWCDAIATT
jgi:hypothetical protein